ncbi:hypothetical protein EVAR_46377_1 [Eumeta japonica]|uniref:Peptidase A2 domain-containing protein n=1 Tax=Eumeta variegata TaxID=151549 RepID=A0A4C1WW17_EUMVA|nr:hypothetical protein EVAR_46377_1 [Eumeta japonica]
MTPPLRNKFAEYWMMKREEGRRETTLIILADFLEREGELAAVYARVAAAPQLSAGAPGRIAERAPRRRKTFKVNTQTEVATKYPKCASEHKLAACDAFKALSNDEKWDFVKREKLCFKCIMKTHPRAYCHAKGCVKCNRGHHTLLHPSTGSDARPAQVTHPNESTVSETMTNIGTGESKALLVPVTIRAADKEMKVHALLDDGATVTLLDDSIASEINAKGPRAELKLISARGHQISDRNSRRVKLKMRGPNGVERDIQCRTITRLDLPSQSLTADEISSHRHLNECRQAAAAHRPGQLGAHHRQRRPAWKVSMYSATPRLTQTVWCFSSAFLPKRAATDAHWCVRNSILHRDLELPTLSKYMKDASKRFFDIAGSHPNALLRAAVDNQPPPPTHFIRRPRNVLFDPPDALTAAVDI